MTQAQSQTQNRLARGWSSMVAQLTAAPDVNTFHERMLDLQCKVVAAEYGILWTRDAEGKPKMAVSWPANMPADPNQNPIYELLHKCAEGGFERQQSHVLKVSPENDTEPAGIGAHVFVTVLRTGNDVSGVATVVADCRDPKVLQSTLPMRELGAGLYEIFSMRQQVVDSERKAHQVRNAMALLASSQEADGFTGASLNLVNELARQLKCTRVSLGWVQGQKIKLKAMSDTEELKRQSDMVGKIELAMSECLDQQQPVVYPAPADAEPLLAEAVIYAHKQLVSASRGTHVLSVPLRLHDEWLGVLTLERVDEPFTPELVTQLMLVADVVAPHLYDRETADKWLIGHAWASVEWFLSYLIGPRHILWKLLVLIISALLMASVFVKIPYKVSTEFALEAESKRIVPSPYEGHLSEVLVKPGETVSKDQTLAKLNATELRLQLAEAHSQLRVQQLQEQKARSERKTADSQMARANIKQINARIELLEYQIDKAVIRSPIAGVVLVGDWNDKVGGVIEMGKPMFEVAPLEDITVKLRVHERDIDRIQAYQELHGKLPDGVLATRSQPDQKFRFKVVRIVPLAGPFNSENVFDVHAVFTNDTWSEAAEYAVNDTVILDGVRYRAAESSGPDTPRGAVRPDIDQDVWYRAQWLRPGMEGVARVDAGERTIIWIASHRVVDAVRLWVWW